MDSSVAYFDPQLLAKIHGLSLRAKHIIDGYLAGAHRSTHHGYSVEFRQHRQSAPGDDLRHVDWKVFGRTDKLYVKQFEDETNLVATLMLDRSQSMHYCGAQSSLTKYDYAACLVVALAWLLRQQGDAVGLATFGDSIDRQLAPSTSDDQLSRIVSLIEHSSPRGTTSVAAALREIAHQVKHRGLVIVASDLLDDPDSTLQALIELKHRKQQVVVFQICDRDEIEFPFHGQTRFSDIEGKTGVSVDPLVLREHYRRLFEQFCDKLRWCCNRESIDLIRVETTQPVDEVLTAFLTCGQRY